MATKKSDSKYPKIRPHIDVGFLPAGESGAEVYGDCLFCGKEGKLYINQETGQWHCKNALCDLSGNVYGFLKEAHSQLLASPIDHDGQIAKLGLDKGLDPEEIKKYELAWDGNRFWIPVKNQNGTFISMRFYHPFLSKRQKPMRGLDGWKLEIYGLDDVRNHSDDAPVYLVEGEWDLMAMRLILERDKKPGLVLAVPGAGVFKDAWLTHFAGRVVYLCYDNDESGRKGRARAVSKLIDVASTVRELDWNPQLADGFDIRDYYLSGYPLDVLHEMMVDSLPRDGAKVYVKDTAELVSEMPAMSEGSRPSFDTVVSVMRRYLHITDEMRNVLRIVYAVIYSNQLGGDPLWIHIVGPPGSGKTEMLMSTATTDLCVVRSSITPNALVSGFKTQGDKDPSLVPQLIGKTFVLKDFTEVISMGSSNKEALFGILRGAFDGEISRDWGNGRSKTYKGYFSIVTGVTQAIFAENHSSLGERFLMYHFLKGSGSDTDDMIMAALMNSGHEMQMKSEIQEIAKKFLEYRVDEHAVPKFDSQYGSRIVGLSQLVAKLRGTVERDFTRERLMYRPQSEAGTRLAKQFKKLLISLAIVTGETEIQEEDYALLVRVALDTCNGFNLEIIQELLIEERQNASMLSETLSIPKTTVREKLEDMHALGILTSESIANPSGLGAPIKCYTVSDSIKDHWKRADIDKALLYRETRRKYYGSKKPKR